MKNPYRAGAGHPPPHLAGRQPQVDEFERFLSQEEITKNVILTGLRGVGKTVLMDNRYRPLALQLGWAWVGSDFSESAFLSEDRLCIRLITDLSVYSSSLSIPTSDAPMGLLPMGDQRQPLDYSFLMSVFNATPGLHADKLKAVFELVWNVSQSDKKQGIVFAYDEAQVVSDRPEKDEYPLAVLLEVFQSIQKKGVRFLLLLTGLPTLFPRLVESRTYAERMFSVQELSRLEPQDSRDAIEVPLRDSDWSFTEEAIATIVNTADGYPYFIQFICREAFDQIRTTGNVSQTVPIEPIVLKLDSDFFGGRWDRLTDRQREFLYCISQVTSAGSEFTISEIVEASKGQEDLKAFSANDTSQMLYRLSDKGLIYKNRVGKYCFAVPMFKEFIIRAMHRPDRQKRLFE